MAQNPWFVKKSKTLRTSQLEKFINKFNEEYEHLMHMTRFKYIKRTLETIKENSDLIINKKTFSILRISCVAQLQPKYLNKIDDGISVYLSNFMLKANHDVEGFCLCFNKIKLKEKESRVMNNDPSIMFVKISFKLLILVLKENYEIKAKINKIEPLKIHLDIFGIVEAIFIEDMFKDFHYDSRNNRFRREGKIFSLYDIVLFTIKKVTHGDNGANVKVIGYF
ncbi:hypothetical protein PRSY57_0207600 [Plasmodium reichenowi]|uniref:RNA polymerase Rpb7-like N-terminal domain-containing protein n=2 Tax=Plasmodium reichenowi TaxID=5854 RepID=A0A151LUZ4_PLARE|nr:hypothetical protein PRSY57_0207600 [Plasmodium reichenowi]KYO03005.1 hypothetical protein PRSY57_0207600 [Plasmodium reichenowi]